MGEPQTQGLFLSFPREYRWHHGGTPHTVPVSVIPPRILLVSMKAPQTWDLFLSCPQGYCWYPWGHPRHGAPFCHSIKDTVDIHGGTSDSGLVSVVSPSIPLVSMGAPQPRRPFLLFAQKYHWYRRGHPSHGAHFCRSLKNTVGIPGSISDMGPMSVVPPRIPLVSQGAPQTRNSFLSFPPKKRWYPRGTQDTKRISVVLPRIPLVSQGAPQTRGPFLSLPPRIPLVSIRAPQTQGPFQSLSQGYCWHPWGHPRHVTRFCCSPKNTVGIHGGTLETRLLSDVPP